MDIQAQVIAIAKQVHIEGWSHGSDISLQTHNAIAVCRAWQDAVQKIFGNRFRAEHSLGVNDYSQKIDLVDVEDRVAYELKVSKNNTHMEFYRDIFKMLVFNHRNPNETLRKFIFITPHAGVKLLGKSFPDDVRKISLTMHLEVEIIGI